MVHLPSVRGTIYDTKMVPLADNIAHFSFGVNPYEVEDKETIISRFSKVTGRDTTYYSERLNSDQSFVFLERNLKYSLCNNLLDIDDKGLIVNQSGYRYYPHQSIAAQTIGFTNVDNIGICGLEIEYEKYLKGKDGWIVLQTDGKGRSYHNLSYPKQVPVNGSDIITTLDIEYQAILTHELKKQMEKSRSTGATGIIMEPHTGRILAICSLPDFNPNNRHNFSEDKYRNKVITDQFEPGSTLKIVPAVASLSLNTVPLDQEFNCEDGSYNYKGIKIIQDWSSFGLLNFPQIIENSSNVGIIKISETVGSKNLYLFAKKFGFGSPTGVRFPGEAKGILRTIDEWSALSLAEISMGHEISVTVLQLALAYSTIANGGFLMKPILVDKIIHPTGKIIFEETPQIIRQVGSKENMEILTSMLCNVVESGTGTSAGIDGWKVAGKTGTAQKFDNGSYSKTKFTSSFAGFFPADNPQLVAVIVLDEPSYYYRWGGVGAAPVFKRIMKRIINSNDQILVHSLHERDLNISSHSNSTKTSENTEPHEEILPLMITGILDQNRTKQKFITIPETRGMSMRQAISTLREVGLRSTISGSGIVIQQNPKPGTEVATNSLCSLQLK